MRVDLMEGMEDIIREMIWQAEKEDNCQLIRYVKQLIDEFATTINCPSNWRDIGSKLAEEYKDNSWVYDELELWNYED